MTDPTGRCPCIDGLPDPCTLCGVPADGVCGLDTVVEFEFRAKKAEAELLTAVPLGYLISLIREEMAEADTDYGPEGSHLPRAALKQLMNRLLKNYGVQG